MEPTDRPTENAPRRRVLLLEQGFMRPRHGKPIHGVELFRLNLICDLAADGIDLTIPCHRWWADHIRQRIDSPGVRIRPVAGVLRVAGTGWLAARAARRRAPYDVVLLGDPGAGMIPAMRAACAARLAPRTIAFCHRVPKQRTVRTMQRLRIRAVVNSEVVAAPFREGGVDARVMYGLPRSDLFHPPGTPRNDDEIRFVLLARLPGHDKGYEVALEAFGKLDPDVRDRCRLHLAAFRDVPNFNDPRIVAHPWMPLERVADLLREMDVHLALSSHETFSQSIVQGMLTALPVIATPIPVYLDKVDPARGGAGAIVVADPFAGDEVARAMSALARDPQRRAALGAAGRAVALERFTWRSDRFVSDVLFPARKSK